MNILNTTTNKINHAVSIAPVKPFKEVTEQAKALTKPQMYYKDCFIDISKMKQFLKNDENLKPSNRDELVNTLVKTNKYSDKDINEILSMIDKILENDRWEETDEKILLEMFNSLAQSDINSDITSMQFITNKICELEQDYDYVEINPICKGICAVSSNIKSNDYKFDEIFIGGYDGFLACENTNLVFQFCDKLESSFQNTDSKKYAELLKILSKKVNINDKKLEEEVLKLEQLSNNYGYKNIELLDALLLHYKENIPIEDIPSKLEIRKTIQPVYDNLKLSNVPNKSFFEDVYAAPIEELTLRGRTPEEIAAMLSIGNYCNKMIGIENMKYANPIIYADFIEDIPKNAVHYEIMKRYTSGSGIFNRIINKYKGNIEESDKSAKYKTSNGYIYSGAKAENVINELTKFLNTCTLKRDIVTYRGSGNSILNQLKTQDGKEIGKTINEAVKHSEKETLKEITAQLRGKSVIQYGFMSTSLSKKRAYDFATYEGSIVWEINLPKGTHAIYADPYNVSHGVEGEILVNRGTKLLINDAKYLDGRFLISADIIQE